jgi:hypothetical protein
MQAHPASYLSHLLCGRLSQNYVLWTFARRNLLIIRSKNRDFASFETAPWGEGGGRAPPREGSFRVPITKAFRTLLRAVAEQNSFNILLPSADNEGGGVWAAGERDRQRGTPAPQAVGAPLVGALASAMATQRTGTRPAPTRPGSERRAAAPNQYPFGRP